MSQTKLYSHPCEFCKRDTLHRNYRCLTCNTPHETGYDRKLRRQQALVHSVTERFYKVHKRKPTRYEISREIHFGTAEQQAGRKARKRITPDDAPASSTAIFRTQHERTKT